MPRVVWYSFLGFRCYRAGTRYLILLPTNTRGSTAQRILSNSRSGKSDLAWPPHPVFFTSARRTRYHLSSPQSFSRLKSPFDVDRMQPRSSLRCCLDRIEIHGLKSAYDIRHCCELFAENSPLSLIFRCKTLRANRFWWRYIACSRIDPQWFCPNSLLRKVLWTRKFFCRQVKK